MDVDDQTNSNHASTVDGDDHQSNHLNFDTANSSNANNSTANASTTPQRSNTNNRKSSKKGGSSTARAPCGYLVFASESRKRLIKDNPGIPFGEMSRMIGDQWRRLTASERDIFEEKARERAREQEIAQSPATASPSTPTATSHSQTSTTTTTYEASSMPVINTQRIVNGSVTINGHYQTTPTVSNVHQINGNVTSLPKPPPTATMVAGPSRTQRLVHSEAYLRYIENLKTDNQFISDWPKQLKATMQSASNVNNGNGTRNLPTNWFSNNSPGLYNNVYEALWSMRDKMWSDVIRIRDVLSDEW